MVKVDDAALLFDLPLLLRAYFRSQNKSLLDYYIFFIKGELLARSRLCFLVSYQSIEIDLIHHGARASRYVPLTPFWKHVECFRGMSVDLPVLVTYFGFVFLSDPCRVSGWCFSRSWWRRSPPSSYGTFMTPFAYGSFPCMYFSICSIFIFRSSSVPF